MKRRKYVAIGSLRFPRQGYFHPQQSVSIMNLHRHRRRDNWRQRKKADAVVVPSGAKDETAPNGH